MNYTLHQLQIFLKIVKTGSITKASEELHLTQPAVSIQLKNFQDQFEIPLTENIGRKIFITDFGNEVAEMAESILQQVHAIHFKSKVHKGSLTGLLKVTIVSTGKYVMPYFLADFMKLHPNVELQMDVTNKNKVIESLEKNNIDMALVSILPKLPLEKLELMQNKLFLVGPKNADIGKQSITKEVFKNMPLIFREEGSGTLQVMEKFIKQKGVVVQKKMSLTSNEAVKQAVIAGLGYSIMPLIGIRNELYTKTLQIIPIKGLPIKTTWSLIWPKGKKHSPVAAAFLDYARKHKQQLVQQNFNWYEQY